MVLNGQIAFVMHNIYVNRTLRRHSFVVHLSSFPGARPVTLALGVTSKLFCRKVVLNQFCGIKNIHSVFFCASSRVCDLSQQVFESCVFRYQLPNHRGGFDFFSPTKTVFNSACACTAIAA